MKQATGRLAAQINKSAATPNTPLGTDTVFAGMPSLLISMGGVDTLGAARDVLQFQTTKPGWQEQKAGIFSNTLTGGSNGNAAAGNLTLLGGGGHTELASANPNPGDSAPGATQVFATVFGAAMPGNVLVFDQTQPAHNQPDTSVSGAVPDLLLGQSFGNKGITLEFGGAPRQGGPHGVQLRDGTEVRISGAPQQGIVEIILPK